MAGGRARRGAAAAMLAAGLAIAAIPALREPAGDAFQVRAAVACRGQVDGKPVDEGTAFHAGERVVFVWFDGRRIRRPTTVRALCRRDGGSIGTQALALPRGSDGGSFSIALKSGAPLLPGRYEVELRIDDRRQAIVAFRVEPDPAPLPPLPPAGGALLERPAEGFAMRAHPAWVAMEEAAGALALLRPEPVAAVLVLVHDVAQPVTAAALADRLGERLKGTAGVRVTRGAGRTVAGRSAPALVVDGDDGTRQEIVLVSRDGGEGTRFFHLAVTAPRARFASAAREFEAMLATFRVIPRAVP